MLHGVWSLKAVVSALGRTKSSEEKMIPSRCWEYLYQVEAVLGALPWLEEPKSKISKMSKLEKCCMQCGP